MKYHHRLIWRSILSSYHFFQLLMPMLMDLKRIKRSIQTTFPFHQLICFFFKNHLYTEGKVFSETYNKIQYDEQKTTLHYFNTSNLCIDDARIRKYMIRTSRTTKLRLVLQLTKFLFLPSLTLFFNRQLTTATLRQPIARSSARIPFLST